MIKKSEKLDKQTSAMKKRKVIKLDIYEPNAEDIYEPDESDIYEPSGEDETDYDVQQQEEFNNNLYCLLEGIGYLNWMLKGNIEVERILKTMKNTITKDIGNDNYESIMHVISDNVLRLKREASEDWELYESIKNPVKKVTTTILS